MQRVIVGDCREVMAGMEPSSVDAIVTDPPAGIAFMGREWDRDKGGRDAWVAWLTDILRECLRVAKPGAHAFVWALPRTSGWTHRALEDAGWEVRDCITHLFGSGFPKSANVSKMIDKAAGAEREIVGSRLGRPGVSADGENYGRGFGRAYEGRSDRPMPALDITAPATDLARQWDGWGTSLKPAAEFWYLARKPLIGTVAANVERHGTGALNIAATRIGIDGGTRRTRQEPYGPEGRMDQGGRQAWRNGVGVVDIGAGRWPANVVLSHLPECEEIGTRRVRGNKAGPNGNNGKSGYDGGWGRDEHIVHYADPDGTEEVAAWRCAEGCPVAMLDAQAGERPSGGVTHVPRRSGYDGGFKSGTSVFREPDSGGPSRYFFVAPADLPIDSGDEPRFRYVAKASRSERNAGLAGMAERQHVEGNYIDFAHAAPEGIGAWLRQKRERAGLTVAQVAAHFPSRTGGLTGCVSNWEKEYNRPTPHQWLALKSVLDFDGGYDAVMTETRPVGLSQCDNPYLRAKTARTNNHPCVKPVALMRWLVRLVTPPGGTVLDPFAGSFTTGIAATLEGFRFIGIEQSEEYVAIGRARMEHVTRYGEGWMQAGRAAFRNAYGTTGTSRLGSPGHLPPQQLQILEKDGCGE